MQAWDSSRVKFSRTQASSLALSGTVLCVLLAIGPLLVLGPFKPPAVQIVPTKVCSCTPQPAMIGRVEARFQARGPPIYENYDEQLGITFTQSFTSMEYNVTALAQTDPSLGTGPAYLVNGLSNAGYWYQVGVSWDWSPGDTPGTGLDMSYEVFDTQGNSIFPTDGQGGVQGFSGPVSAGDIILLNLYFSNATGNVVMLAYDTNTGAFASETYSSMGATYFVGLPGSPANSIGYFTGLMTEWYHGLPYYTDENPVAYSGPGSGVTSAWMWMDEFDASNSAAVFASNTTSPVPFTDPLKLQEFSYNGTTEFADASQFVTGALSNATGTSGVPLVLSFGVRGGGTGYSPPVLNFVSGGKNYSVSLTNQPVLYLVENGTGWSVSSTLGGSNSTRRWVTSQNTAGLTASPTASALVYYEQEDVRFGFNITGGGSGYSPPLVNYSSFDKVSTTPLGVEVWADIGSSYQYTNPLPGSNASERWVAVPAGIIGHSSQISVTYYHQSLLTFVVSYKNTGILPALSLQSTSEGKAYSAGLLEGANKVWLDSGGTYAVPQSYLEGSGQRFVVNGTFSGVVSGSSTVYIVYEHQFYEQLEASPTTGGEVSPPTGWYDSGTVLQLGAVAAQGWQFEGWQGSGTDSVSGVQPGPSLTVGPAVPSTEVAAFYPSVTIIASGPSSVSYKDGSVSGTVSAGATEVLSVPPGSALTLTGSSLPLLTSFSGWHGASNSTTESVTLQVSGPVTLNGSSAYNIPGIVGLLLALTVVVVAAAAFWRGRRSLGRPKTAANSASVATPSPTGSSKSATTSPGGIEITERRFSSAFGLRTQSCPVAAPS